MKAELVLGTLQDALRPPLVALPQELHLRPALEAASTRRIVYNQLIRQGVDTETAKAINDQSWQRSVESLNKPLAAIDELIRTSVEP